MSISLKAVEKFAAAIVILSCAFAFAVAVMCILFEFGASVGRVTPAC